MNRLLLSTCLEYYSKWDIHIQRKEFKAERIFILFAFVIQRANPKPLLLSRRELFHKTWLPLIWCMLMWLVIPNPLVFVKLNTLGAITGTTATRITRSTHCTSVTSIKWKPFLRRIKLVWRKHIILHILCTYFPRNMTFISYLEWSVIRTWVASVTGSLKGIFSLTLEV